MVELLQAPSLLALPVVIHGFTDRRGGVSRGALASLNLARRPGEDDAALASNWAAALSALGAPDLSLALAEQVHGDAALLAEVGGGPFAPLGRADAVWTDRPGVVVAVRVADCVPILLAAPGAVAAVHAGWRGTALKVVERAVEALAARTGASPAQMAAAIGPAIGPCCYEVGAEVADPVGEIEPSAVSMGPRGRPHVDLRAANVALLRALGVPVEVVGPCTACSPDLYSHRADGPETGRQAGLIALLPT